MRVYDRELCLTASTAALGTISALGQIPSIILNGYDPMSGVIMMTSLNMAVLFGLRLPRVYKKWKRLHDMMKTDEYKEYCELYKEYVSDIAKLLKELGTKGDLSGSYLFKLCLDEGIFSEERDVSFESVKGDTYDHFLDVMGGRIATGAFCCRHAASLLTDVINEMGGKAANVGVCRKEFEKKSINDEANHLVTALVHEGGRIIVDPALPESYFPVAGMIFIDKKVKLGKKVNASSMGELITYQEKASEFLFDSENAKKLREVLAYPSLDYDCNAMIEYTEAFKIFEDKRGVIEEFRNEEMPKIKRLSKLNYFVTPHDRAKTKK